MARQKSLAFGRIGHDADVCCIMISIPQLCRSLTMALFAVTVAYGQVKSDGENPAVVTRIAFGSCFHPRERTEVMLDAVIRSHPEVFVFLGDNIYGDTADMSLLRKKYEELGALRSYQTLRRESTLLATWDDHDFGVNDGGKSYAKRDESQRIFLDFFQEPANSLRRQRPGVYASYRFGTPGKVCQILLLDTRYFRDELPRRKGPPAPGTVGWYEPTKDVSKTLLGEVQWRWLEQQLEIPADVRIIASSIQILADEKGMENWGNVPQEQKRLFALLRSKKAHHTIGISGDVHFAELSKKTTDGYPFYDLTSSGLSHVNASWAKARNSYRVGDSHAVLNAGSVEIDWERRSLELAIMNQKGEKILRHPVKFDELRF